eukprot:TRINITY_DN3550_c0_g1_i1.p1 TRINITY_DN3550_c0_g1~~TRINITY_DN3550_c0_g1_i1.p1  ORF type:complete len:1339 (-),score=272.23 TRINITY_DN3550_c0_g1_i1:208-4116(-)
MAAIKADFSVVSTANDELKNDGFMTGKLYYDFNRKVMLLTYDRNSYSELFVFNDVGGYNNDVDQVFYQKASGTPCNGNCQKSKMPYEIPYFEGLPPASSSNYGRESLTKKFGSTTCTRYSIVGGDNGFQVRYVWYSSSNKLCGFQMRNSRLYTVTNISSLTTDPFGLPEGCQCQEKLDIIVIVDGSGSIDSTEWGQINDWIRDLVQSFEWGANAGSLAVIQFSSDARIETNFQSNKSQLTRFFASDMGKLGGGTDVVEGLELARDRLYPSRRAGAETIIITLTDGVDSSSASTIANEINYHKVRGTNHFIAIAISNQYSTSTSGCIKCSTGISTFTTRSSFIPRKRSALGNVLDKIGTLNEKYFGEEQEPMSDSMESEVGEEGMKRGVMDIPSEQLEAIAGGRSDRVYEYNNFNQFKENLEEIVTDACSASVGSDSGNCGAGCCGFCMCSTCVSPMGCDDGKDCTTESLTSAGSNLQCCGSPSERCGADSVCEVYSCGSSGECVATPKPCATKDPCKTAVCTEANGCQIKDKCPASSDPCFKATCNNGVCGTAPISCPADTKCTKYACSAGKCVASSVSCDDKDVCTADSCVDSTGCKHVPTECEGCCGDAVDTACIANICDKGTCVQKSKCQSGKLSADKCMRQTGNCAADGKSCEEVPVCSASGDPCKENTCQADGTCKLVNVLPTDDKCKIPEANGNTCAFRTVECPASDKCNSWACVPATGECKNTKVTCDNSDKCYKEVCNMSTGACDRTSTFDDGNKCTVDTCKNGVASHVPKCPASTDVCFVNDCVASSGECTSTKVPCPSDCVGVECEDHPCYQVDCDDNNACTRDVCTDGQCTNTNTCTTTDKCIVPECAAADGICNLNPKECIPKNKCFTSACEAGTGNCIDTPISCDDGNACTVDSCDPDAAGDGCVNAPYCEAKMCVDNQCELVDGAPTCVGTATCTDDDRCKVPHCDETNGECTFTDFVCPAGDACTATKCVDGGCVPVDTICDDNDPCTTDSCHPVDGCVFADGACECVPHTPSNICTEYSCYAGVTTSKERCVEKTEGCWHFTGACDLDTGCEKRLICVPEDGCAIASCENDICVSNPVSCDDGNPCTVDSCTGDGECVNVPLETKCQTAFPNPETGQCDLTDISSQCDDFNICTIDSCDPDTGCVHQNDTVFIDDCVASGEGTCSINSCDPIEGCIGVLKECPAGDGCSVGICEKGECTIYAPLLCDDEITTVAVAGSLGVAAIIGIVVGIVACLAASGAAAYKGYNALQTTEDDFDQYGESSPIYEMAEVGGSNALYESADALGI